MALAIDLMCGAAASSYKLPQPRMTVQCSPNYSDNKKPASLCIASHNSPEAFGHARTFEDCGGCARHM